MFTINFCGKDISQPLIVQVLFVKKKCQKEIKTKWQEKGSNPDFRLTAKRPNHWACPSSMFYLQTIWLYSFSVLWYIFAWIKDSVSWVVCRVCISFHNLFQICNSMFEEALGVRGWVEEAQLSRLAHFEPFGSTSNRTQEALYRLFESSFS